MPYQVEKLGFASRKLVTRLVVLALVAASALLALPGSADAAPYPCRREGGEYRSQCVNVTAVSGSSLPLRLGVGYGNTVPGTAYRNGDQLALACWTAGPQDAAGTGDRYWFEVFDPNDTSVEGYVNDYNLTTGEPADWQSHVSHCNDPTPATGTPYKCRKQGGEYRSWCANVTAVPEDMWLPLDKQPGYTHGTVSDTTYHNGDPLALSCWTTGPQDYGQHGDTYWFKVFDPNNTATEGYVNDYSLTTGAPSDWKSVISKCTSTPPGQNPPPPTHYDHTVRVLQWNIAGVAKNWGAPAPDQRLVDVAKQKHAQLISMNETCDGQAHDVALQLGAQIGRTVYYAFIPTVWNPLCLPSGLGWAGSALLSTAPLSDFSYRYFTVASPPGHPDVPKVVLTSRRQERGVVCATVHLSAPLRACSVHLAKPQQHLHAGPHDDRLLAPSQAQALTNADRSKLSKTPSIVVGDFNSHPDGISHYAPSYDPANAQGIFYEADLLRNDVTFPHGNGGGERLDYIFATRRHFQAPTRSSATIIPAGTCTWWNPLGTPCSDHSMLFGTLQYHE